MKKKIVVFFSIICLSVCAHGQIYRPYTHHRNIPDSVEKIFNIKYQIPNSFNFLDTLIVWIIKDTIGPGFFYAPVMQSVDKECMLLYAASPWYVPDYEFIESCRCPDKSFFRGKNLAHRNTMMGDLEALLDTRDFNPDDYISTLPNRKARKWFNADSAFTFQVSKPKMILDKYYGHCTRLFLSRKDRPFMMFVLYFSDRGEKRKYKYLSELKKNIWYHEGEWSINLMNWSGWFGTGFCNDSGIKY